MEHDQPIESSNAESPSANASQLNVNQAKADDNLSIKSSDSVTTSGEYEIVPEAPSLSDTVDGACSTLPSPIMNIVKTGGEGSTTPKKQQEAEPVRDPKLAASSGGELLNLSECFDDEEVLVSLVAVGPPKKLDAISPILNIEGNGNVMDLEKNMDEVIHELDEERTLSASDGEPGSANKSKFLFDCGRGEEGGFCLLQMLIYCVLCGF